MTAALQMMQIPPSGMASPKLPLHAKGSTKGGPGTGEPVNAIP